jgi:hypothetical protein
VRVTTPDGADLPSRNDLRDHSPSGFEWGYAGSGPLQLGLALLAHSQANDEVALEHYRDFTRMIVATLPEGNWSLTTAEIAEGLASIQNLRGK